MTSRYKVNLACGSVFVANDDSWVNFDYNPCSSFVKHADLLKPLPLKDSSAVLLYSSHFLEHIPRPKVFKFLSECFRVLGSGGVIRLVLPDLDNICQTYLRHRDCGEHEKANFVVLEMIDQCVRSNSGGELGRLYGKLKEDIGNYKDLISYVRERTGENLLASLSGQQFAKRDVLNRVNAHLERLWIRALVSLLPTAFRTQNVSLCSVGERHQWLWDFHQLQDVLQSVGFVAIESCGATSSRYLGFPFHLLDVDSDGRPRKGVESMYIEALKP